MSEIDPTRAPDWRWTEAIRRANGMLSAPGEFCGLTNRAVTLLKLQRQARTSAARARLEEKFPTIAMAQRIRFDSRDGRRDAIEVRLLAGDPPGRIATLSALAPVVVWVYIALFFDVWDRLDAGDFVWSRVIGFQLDGDGEAAAERKAIRWLAWICGPHVADALLLPGQRVGFVERDEDVNDVLIAAAEALLARATALAPFVDRLDREQARQIVRLRMQARQLREADAGDGGYREYVANVAAFMENIELTIGRSTIPRDDNEKYYTSRVEPRAEEWASISRGQPVPEFDERVAATASIRSKGAGGDGADDQEEPAAGQMRGSQNA